MTGNAAIWMESSMLLENAARQQKRICMQCRLANVVLHLNASWESLWNKQHLCGPVADYKQCFSMGFRTFNLEACRGVGCSSWTS